MKPNLANDYNKRGVIVISYPFFVIILFFCCLAYFNLLNLYLLNLLFCSFFTL